MALYPLAKQFHPDFADPRVLPKGPINWGNPITRRLATLWVPHSGGVDLVKNAPGFKTSGYTFNGSERGLVGGNTGTDYAHLETANSIGSSEGITIIALVRSNNTSQTNKHIFGWSSSTDNDPIATMILDGITNKLEFFLRNDAGSGVNLQSIESVLTDTDFHTIATSATIGASGIKYYNDGEQLTTRTGTPSAAPYTFDRVGVSALVRASTALHFDGDIAWGMVFNRELSPEEVRAISVNPNQLINPSVPLFYYTAAAGGGTRPQGPFGHVFKGVFGGPI